jgi:hypothetical protein
MTSERMLNRLGELRFATRNEFIPKVEMDLYRDEISIISQRARELFTSKSLEVLQDVIANDVEQYKVVTLGAKKGQWFDRYHTEHLKEEKTAQVGYEFKPTIGFRLADGVDDNGEPLGNILEARFVTYANVHISENTNPRDVTEYLSQTDEIYVKYTRVDDNNRPHKSAGLRVTTHGIQLLELIIGDDDIDDMVCRAQPESQFLLVDGEIGVAEVAAELIGKLASMKLVKYKTVKI